MTPEQIGWYVGVFLVCTASYVAVVCDDKTMRIAPPQVHVILFILGPVVWFAMGVVITVESFQRTTGWCNANDSSPEE